MAIDGYAKSIRGELANIDELSFAKNVLGTENISAFIHVPALSGLIGCFEDHVGVVSNAYVSGGFKLQTAATLNSYVRLSAGFVSTFARAFLSGNDWFVSARFRVDSAPDATTMAYVGLADPTGAAPLRLGVHGPTSATNYVMQGPAGTAVDSGVAIDANYHTIRGYNVGGVAILDLDGAEHAGDTNTASDTCPIFQVLNGALAAQQVTLQWWCGAAVAP